ncbi:MAG: thioredoxin-dependent thiol peroxidase [Polyangiales bacterium]
MAKAKSGATTPAVGEKAPGFSLQSDAGETVTLAGLKGRWVVLYFYPKDDTPGCTVEAKEFTDLADDFAKDGVTVLGVSKDTVASHCKFRDKHGLRVTLLSDPDLAVQRAYGAWGEKNMYGKTVEGTLRTTFLIDPDGDIESVWTSVRAAGHAAKVLDAARAAQTSG